MNDQNREETLQVVCEVQAERIARGSEGVEKNVNPTQMKTGIRSMKSVKGGRIVIESGSKAEIDLLSKKITEKCSHVLEVNIPKLRKPNIIIYDVPEDIGTDNLAATILTQNQLTMDSIRPTYSFKNKKQIKNVLIAEVEPETLADSGAEYSQIRLATLQSCGLCESVR